MEIVKKKKRERERSMIVWGCGVGPIAHLNLNSSTKYN